MEGGERDKKTGRQSGVSRVGERERERKRSEQRSRVQGKAPKKPLKPPDVLGSQRLMYSILWSNNKAKKLYIYTTQTKLAPSSLAVTIADFPSPPPPTARALITPWCPLWWAISVPFRTSYVLRVASAEAVVSIWLRGAGCRQMEVMAYGDDRLDSSTNGRQDIKRTETNLGVFQRTPQPSRRHVPHKRFSVRPGTDDDSVSSDIHKHQALHAFSVLVSLEPPNDLGLDQIDHPDPTRPSAHHRQIRRRVDGQGGDPVS